MLRASLFVLAAYGGLLGLSYWEFVHASTGFIPQQDKGYLILSVQMPDSASVERTRWAMGRIEEVARKTPGVAHTVGVSGLSLIQNVNAPNLGSMYVMLNEFSERRGPTMTADAIADALRENCRREVRAAIVDAFGPPLIDGLGTTSGLKLILEDRGNYGPGSLQRVSDQVVARGNKTTGLQGFYSSSRTPDRHALDLP